MKKQIALITLISLITFSAKAGNENFSAGARQAGMGNAGVTLTDLWSVQQNQAGLAGLKKISAGLYYESKYILPELGLRCGALAMPMKNIGVFGLYISDYGNKNYKEQKAGLAYSKMFGKAVMFGVQLSYLNTAIGEDYGSRSALTAEAGVIVRLSSTLDIGAHIYNPNRTKLAEYNDERSPTIMKMGFGYHFSKKVTAAAEAEKDINNKNVFKAGLEYDIHKIVSLRAGISSNPALFNFGFGIKMNNFKLDVATSMHQVLGYSPKVALIYEFK